LAGYVGAQDSDDHIGIVFHLVNSGLETLSDVTVYCVTCLGAIESDECDFALNFIVDDV
jgi:hypothetical protein